MSKGTIGPHPNESQFVVDISTYLKTDEQTMQCLYFIKWMQLILDAWSRETMPTVLHTYCSESEKLGRS